MTLQAQANQRMTRLLGTDPHQFIAENEEAGSQMTESLARAVLGDGVTTRSGAAFLTSGLRRNAHLFRADDLTGSQAAINAIHLDQFVHGDRWAAECVRLGVQLARGILDRVDPDERQGLEFVISAADRSPGTLRCSVVRFYQHWPEEPPWLAEDLDVYIEAVLRLREI